MSDPNLGWLAAAFGVAWVAIGAYLVRLVRAQREIDRKLDELSKRGD
jgi:CcmD family protein